jgi:mycothiol synthase
MPPGYELREAHESDAPELARLLREAFDESWTTEFAWKELLANATVVGTFVVEREGRFAATASYQIRPEVSPEGGWVHWVASDPSERGQGLGYIVSRRVLEACVADSRPEALLETQDHRLPAIRTYLKLGFLPDSWHPSHVDRWSAIYKRLR